ncbi:MAG: DUF1289 domain-containing protein [Rhodospirillaceae bacterium]
MNVPPPRDPCIYKCELDLDSGRCLGCGRLVEDMMAWRGLSRPQREAALKEAQEFLEAKKTASESR